jgi:hypothetical protein
VIKTTGWVTAPGDGDGFPPNQATPIPRRPINTVPLDGSQPQAEVTASILATRGTDLDDSCGSSVLLLATFADTLANATRDLPRTAVDMRSYRKAPCSAVRTTRGRSFRHRAKSTGVGRPLKTVNPSDRYSMRRDCEMPLYRISPGMVAGPDD